MTESKTLYKIVSWHSKVQRSPPAMLEITPDQPDATASLCRNCKVSQYNVVNYPTANPSFYCSSLITRAGLVVDIADVLLDSTTSGGDRYTLLKKFLNMARCKPKSNR